MEVIKIKNGKTGVELEICPMEYFPRRMTWHNAKLKCEKLGNGWRLPTKEELLFIKQVISENKPEVLSNEFIHHFYWTSDIFNDFDAWACGFGEGVTTGLSHMDFNSEQGVRAIRTV